MTRTLSKPGSNDHDIDSAGATRRRLIWALAANFAFFVVEVTGGLLSGSLALLADAGHMLTDVAALGIAIAASHLAARPPDPKRTFGLVRAEVVGAFINGGSLVVIVLFIIWESWKRLGAPVQIDGPLMAVIAALGLLTNLASTLILLGRRNDNLNIRAAFLHMLGDTFGSVGAITAGVVIWTTGWIHIDIIVSLLIGGIILWGSVKLLRETIKIIINATPEDVDYEEVKQALLAIEHFAGLHDLHIWSLATGYPVLSAHIRLEPGCSDSAHWQECLWNAKVMLKKRFGITHTTLQLEPESFESEELHSKVYYRPDQP